MNQCDIYKRELLEMAKRNPKAFFIGLVSMENSIILTDLNYTKLGKIYNEFLENGDQLLSEEIINKVKGF